jgi:hypothetical protein
VILSPADSATLPAATPPTFVFDTTSNVKFRLEISTSSGFVPAQTKAYTYTVPNPNVTTTLVKTLSSSQWTAVKALIGSGKGYFRVRGWDGINRLSDSVTRIFTIL